MSKLLRPTLRPLRQSSTCGRHVSVRQGIEALATAARPVARLSNPKQEHHDSGDEQEREKETDEDEAADDDKGEAQAADGIGQAHEVSPKSQVTR